MLGVTAVWSYGRGAPGLVFGLGTERRGETTTIRMVMRIVLPDSGRIPFADGISFISFESYRLLAGGAGLYRRTLEHLTFLGEVRGLARPRRRRVVRGWKYSASPTRRHGAWRSSRKACSKRCSSPER